MRTAFVFPGQGSQFVGMGEGLFERFPDEVGAADAVLGYSVRRLCLDDPDRELNQTRWTQPALFVVNALMYLDHVRRSGVRPACTAGHSLGEYSALFAAGAFDFITGVRLVKKRGELTSQARGGGMAAVMGLNADAVRRVLKEDGLTAIELANLNSPEQLVITGPADDIVRAEGLFLARGAKRYVRLPVSAAFHSSYMSAAAERFGLFLDDFVVSNPRIPVISNVEALPYPDGQVKTLMVRQITSSVRWEETVAYLMGQPDLQIEEIGPGRVLTGLVERIRQAAVRT
jgi:malonyl CoA-acyl carrier protein transacylase